MTPLKHAKLIKAWADGATVQKLNRDGSWIDVHPNWPWYDDWTYRLKPRADAMYLFRLIEHSGGVMYTPHSLPATDVSRANIKVVFDGETGKLKSAEVL